MKDGRIMKALSGFYYVMTSDYCLYQCRGRGVFRNKKITPLVGDFVSFDVVNENEGYLAVIKERKNELIRPPIANIDQAIILCSAVMPKFSTTLLDRFLVLIESKHIDPVIFITKMDAVSPIEKAQIAAYQRNYEAIGYQVELLSSTESPLSLQPYFNNKVSVFTGQSGVGKTTLLNAMDPTLELKTADISTSLGRGKHTTRHVELLEIYNGFIADTPGFSSLDFSGIDLTDLPTYFPEFTDRANECKFRGCMHDKEPKCAVKAAVDNSEIAAHRYQHYLDFYGEIQSRKVRY